MNASTTLNESLHRDEFLKKGDFFLKYGKPCTKIGMLKKGVMRGFVYDNDGNEITTHFYQEGDMVVGSYIPNINMSMNIQALEDCEISVANFAEVMAQVNKDPQITEIITREFEKLNKQLQTSEILWKMNNTSI